MSGEKVSDDFLKMFDALMIIESPTDARELAKNPDLIEDLDFHESAGEDSTGVSDDVPGAASGESEEK